MAVEHIHLVKRTIFVAKCKTCGDSKEVDKDPPRERYCSECKVWIPYEEVSFTGPSLDKGKS